MKLKFQLKCLLNKIKKLLKNKNFYLIIASILPFILMDLVTRIYTSSINFVKINYAPAWGFTIIWSLLFIGIAFSFKKNWSKVIYSIFFGLSFILFVVQNIYFQFTNEVFDFHLVELASEGSSYFMDALKATNIWFYLIAIVLLGGTVTLIYFLPRPKKFNFILFPITLVLFITFHLLLPATLGKANTTLSWNSWYNKRNIYINFNDSNKALSITGLYEYSYRNAYLTFLKKNTNEDENQREFLNNLINDETNISNSYTGKYKDKNIIFLQMEGIDNWLVTKETMPNLYNLMQKSINFTNHYSYYNGGGSTFNSEFAINTGYLTPITYTKNAYTFNKNTFTYSMARLLKDEGYTVNAFHMNSGEYYSRTINYKSWGFDHYYGLKDLKEYTDDSYELDRELILNENFYNLIFNKEQKFVDYIITYSNHMPFSTEKGVCKLILDTKEKEKEQLALENGETYEPKTYTYTEEECIKIQAKETDDMIGLLVQGLIDNGLYDDTIIVAYADHYLYSVSDKTILDKYKNTSNNLINKTPLFIWSSDTKKQTKINKVTSQINILPTVLNLMGIKYNSSYYTGEDALSKNYTGIAFFNDYSWYDGKIYVDGNGVATGSKDEKLIAEKSNYVNTVIKKNDLILKYDYFKYN